MADLGLPNLGSGDAADLLRSLGFEVHAVDGQDMASWAKVCLARRRSLSPELARLKLGLSTRTQ